MNDLTTENMVPEEQIGFIEPERNRKESRFTYIDNSFAENEVWIRETEGELFDEFKRCRTVSKQAIAGSIATAKSSLEMYKQVIDVCSRELNRTDLPEDQRTMYIQTAQEAMALSREVDRENRQFVSGETQKDRIMFGIGGAAIVFLIYTAIKGA